VLGLDDATSGRVNAFLETEVARLKAQQLTANFRPENEPYPSGDHESTAKMQTLRAAAHRYASSHWVQKTAVLPKHTEANDPATLRLKQAQPQRSG